MTQALWMHSYSSVLISPVLHHRWEGSGWHIRVLSAGKYVIFNDDNNNNNTAQLDWFVCPFLKDSSGIYSNWSRLSENGRPIKIKSERGTLWFSVKALLFTLVSWHQWNLIINEGSNLESNSVLVLIATDALQLKHIMEKMTDWCIFICI